MSDSKLKEPSKNMITEMAISESERQSETERTEREKNAFAENLKKTIGAEMKSVLLEKKEEEKKPIKKSKIKEFFERLIRTCQ